MTDLLSIKNKPWTKELNNELFKYIKNHNSVKDVAIAMRRTSNEIKLQIKKKIIQSDLRRYPASMMQDMWDFADNDFEYYMDE